MAEFYDNFASLAQRLIRSRGQEVKFTRAVAGSQDPITGVGTPGTSITFTGFGLVFDYQSTLIDGVQIQAQDKRLLLEPSLTGGNAPQIDDVVTTANGNYTTLRVEPLSPAGTVVKYDVQLRS